MLRYGADQNFPARWAENVYEDAIRSQDLFQLAPFLSNYDLDHKIGGNKTGLMIAASIGNFDMVKRFLDENVNADAEDVNGLIARDYALRGGHKSIVDIIDLYTSPEWDEILRLQKDLNQFAYDITTSSQILVASDPVAEVRVQLSNPKYNSLRKYIIDAPLLDDELVWFGKSNYSIALTQSNRKQWMLDDRRVKHEW